MAAETIRILSATRSELAGMSVGVGNIFERPDHPRGWSCQLVLPDRTLVVGIGDEVDIAGARFRLAGFDEGRAGRAAVFERIEAPPRRSLSTLVDGRLEVVDLPEAMSATTLAKRLRDASPDVLEAIGQLRAPPLEWRKTSRDETHREWNGGTLGPSRLTRWTATFGDGRAMEASVSLDVIRWSPDEVHRTEVAGFWRYADRSGSLFARADGTAPVEAVRLIGLDETQRAVILEVLGVAS